ncbi:ABC transporter substrate-binding protein [Luxibacter massiliensis]|uniref:ABC transporter substrate-binding protein n=1 Tax=Luxibacter massiliensis TaxID=2219695 RepID=UPI001F3B373B|nr:extracellular solute-binding protein [Luxibacter massiliensis]
MRKKIVSGLLIFSMIGSMILTGCSGGSSEKSSDSGSSGQAESTDSRFTYDGKDVTLNFMFITGGENEFYNETLPELVHEQFPNIDIEVEELPSDNYKSTIQMKFASGEGPDLFEWWPDKQAEPLIEAGYCLDLSDLECIGDFREDMVDSFTFDDKNYAVPLGSSFLTTWYNESMFEEAGISEAPMNWEEFIDCCEKLKSAGITPIVMGDKDAYVIQFGIYMTGASAIYADNPEFDDQLYTGETKFTDACWVEAVEKYKYLYDNGYVMEDTLGLSHDQARQAFIDGRAAMTFDGSFGWEALMAEGAAEFERGLFMLPSNEEGEDMVYNLTPAEGIFGGANEGHEDAVKAVMSYWFTEGTPLFEEWAKTNDNIPAHNNLSDNRELIQEYFARYDGLSTIYNLNNAWPNGVSDEMTAKFQEVIAGDASAEDVTTAMQTKFEQVK